MKDALRACGWHSKHIEVWIQVDNVQEAGGWEAWTRYRAFSDVSDATAISF